MANLQKKIKTTKKMLEKIKKTAKKSGYHDVRYAGKWEGYKVYEPIFSDGKEHIIGFPQYVLVKEGKLRWSKNADEGMAILEALMPEE